MLIKKILVGMRAGRTISNDIDIPNKKPYSLYLPYDSLYILYPG